jgi:hypothetical protein
MTPDGVNPAGTLRDHENRAHTENVPPRPPVRRVLAGSPFAQPAVIPPAHTRMSPGTRVTHDRLGLGRVVRIVDDRDVIVNFGHEEGHLHSVPHTTLTLLEGEG